MRRDGTGHKIQHLPLPVTCRQRLLLMVTDVQHLPRINLNLDYLGHVDTALDDATGQVNQRDL